MRYTLSTDLRHVPTKTGKNLPGTVAYAMDEPMLSHIVVFWTDPAKPQAVDELVAGAERYLPSIPGIVRFHVGRMVTSPRPVVDQTYQVALNVQFNDKVALDQYQVHPQHQQFLEKFFKPLCRKVLVYDFEG